MAEDAVIQIAYNRKMLGRLVAFYTALCILLLPMIVFLGGGAIHLILTKIWPNRLLGSLSLLEVIAFAALLPYFFGYVSMLRQAFQRNEPAMIANKTGVVDHASGYMVGQIAWDEIQRMGPWTREVRLLSNRFFKTPIITRHRFFVVALKDRAYLKRLPRFTSFCLKMDTNHGQGRWLLVPEYLLEITSEEVITRLSDFYTTEVRGAA